MNDFHLVDMLSNLPSPHDMDAVKFGIENWRTAINELATQKPKATHVTDIAESILTDPGARTLLEAIFGNSFYLSQSILNDPKFFCDLVSTRPDVIAANLIADFAEKDKYFINELELMKALRILKRRMALTIAVTDIGNVWGIDQITRQLSEIAAITLSAATSYLLRSRPYQDFLNLTNDLTPEKDSGLIVIGMGKLGAFELNYSSDIDLIVLYDTDKISSKAPEKLQNQLVRLTRQLLKVMNERTEDGYVFRTDLRLRPDPAATPLALSVLAAESYYESIGQNWERAAMIKARPVGGDKDAGDAFLKLTGAQNAFASFQGWKPASAESIIANNPDYIIVTNRLLKRFSNLEELRNHPSLSQTKAAKKNQIIAKDGMAMMGFGPRTISCALEVSKIFSSK